MPREAWKEEAPVEFAQSSAWSPKQQDGWIKDGKWGWLKYNTQ
jgi:hypothetical protein